MKSYLLDVKKWNSNFPANLKSTLGSYYIKFSRELDVKNPKLRHGLDNGTKLIEALEVGYGLDPSNKYIKKPTFTVTCLKCSTKNDKGKREINIKFRYTFFLENGTNLNRFAINRLIEKAGFGHDRKKLISIAWHIKIDSSSDFLSTDFLSKNFWVQEFLEEPFIEWEILEDQNVLKLTIIITEEFKDYIEKDIADFMTIDYSELISISFGWFVWDKVKIKENCKEMFKPGLLNKFPILELGSIIDNFTLESIRDLLIEIYDINNEVKIKLRENQEEFILRKVLAFDKKLFIENQ